MAHCCDLRAARLDSLKKPFLSEVGSLQAATDLASGKLNLGFVDLDMPRFDVDGVDESFWRRVPDAHGNTFALYLCGLRPIFLLGDGALETGNRDFLGLADAFVTSFAEHATGTHPADMVFNDHAIAERVENLTFLLHAASELDYELVSHDLISELVRRDALLLLDGPSYQAQHNHGIIADRAVLLAAVLLQEKESAQWTERAVARLRLQVAHAFDADGVHCENSFDYHLIVTTLLASCVEVLQLIDDPYAEELEGVLDRACEFIAYALKPNRQSPLFGDSKGSLPGNHRVTSHAKSLPDSAGHVRYVLSRGTEGSRPSHLVRRFSSGYVFLRSSFDPDNFDQATWISLKAGYTTRVHKQRDDLALGLYSKGYDIFVDSGMAGYMPHDPVTRHMASVAAHTTTAVEGAEQSLAVANGRKFRIVAFRQHGSWDYVAASNHAIAGVAIYRHLYYFRESDVLIIHDEFISDNPHTYLQYFKLSPDVSLVAPDHDGVQLAVAATGFVVDMIQLAGYDNLQLSTGTTGSPMSVVSTGFGTVRPTQTLTYRVTGSEADLITAVRIRSSTDEPLAIELRDDSMLVGPHELPRVRSTPPRFYGSKISAVGSSIHFTNERGPGAESFAVYAYSLDDGRVLSKQDYTSAATLVAENPDRLDCVLVYFVRNSQFDRTEGVLAVCRYKENGVELFSYPELHAPAVNGTSWRPFGDTGREFEFTVDLHYDFPARCRWWVYRNGVNIHHEFAGQSVARFEFDRPGTYVVMCSVVDRMFGESWFGQFDPITVNAEDLTAGAREVGAEQVLSPSLLPSLAAEPAGSPSPPREA